MTRIYFAKPIGMQGPVKIGMTQRIEERLTSLNALAAFPLELVATMPGDRHLEARLHHKFIDDRSHGEWFRWSPELQAVMDAIQDGSFAESDLPPPLYLCGAGFKLAGIAARRKRMQERRPEVNAPELLAKVEDYIRHHQVAPSTFGRKVAGDPQLLFMMRKGRHPRPETADRIEAFIESAAA